MKSWVENLTGYFIYMLAVSTIGTLLFGYHLASQALTYSHKHTLTLTNRLS